MIMAAIQFPRARGDVGALSSADALLAQLNSSTDLAGLVERVVRNNLPWVVVPAAALRAWDAKDAPGRAPRKPVAGPPKKTKPSPNLERATRPEPDSPVLNLLWLLTASRRH